MSEKLEEMQKRALGKGPRQRRGKSRKALSPSERLRICYLGGQPFISTFLEQYSVAETANDFKLKQRLAYNRVPVKPYVSNIEGTVKKSASQFMLTTPSEAINELIENNIDRRGNDWLNWMIEAPLRWAVVQGKSFVVTGQPVFEGELTLAEAQASNINPYLFLVRLDQVINFEFEENSLQVFKQFRYWDTWKTGEDDMGFPVMEQVQIHITKESYTIFQGDGKKIIDQFTNVLEEVPVTMIDIGQSLIADACDISITALNTEASNKIVLFKSGFSFLCFFTDAAVNDVKVGPGSGLGLGANDKVDWLTMPTEAVNFIKEDNEAMKEQADQSVNQSLRSFAKQSNKMSGESQKESFKELEAAVMTVVSALKPIKKNISWMGTFIGEPFPPEEVELVLAESYQTETLLAKVERTSALDDVKFESELGKAELRKLQVDSLFSGELAEEIKKAEEEAIKEQADRKSRSDARKEPTDLDKDRKALVEELNDEDGGLDNLNNPETGAA